MIGVDRRPAAVVVLVGRHRERLLRLVVGDRERAAADAVEAVVAVDRVRRRLGLPDVLRDDVDLDRRELRVGDRRRDRDGPLVDHLGGQVRHRGDVVRPLLVAGGVDVPGDVLGGDRLAVGPLQPLAEGVGVAQTRLVLDPRLGETGLGREVLGRPCREARVLDVPDLVLGDGEADDRVERLPGLGQTDDHRHVVLRSGRRARRSRRSTVPTRRPAPNRRLDIDCLPKRTGRPSAGGLSTVILTSNSL